MASSKTQPTSTTTLTTSGAGAGAGASHEEVQRNGFDGSMATKKLIILDGGIGHELKLRGVSDGTFVAGVLANEDCSTNNVVEAIHRDYLAAGCVVITTNSFVAVPQRMIECDLATNDSNSKRRASQLIIAAVNRARGAIAKHNENVQVDKRNKMIAVAGCIPPLTECYFSNKVPSSVECLMPDYTVILSTLLECNVDILLAETLSTTREAQAILRSLYCIRQTEKHRIPPLWMSFTIHDDQPSKLRSDEPLDMVCQSILREATALNLPLEAVGINCSTPSAISEAVPGLVKLVEGTGIQVCAYANCFKTTTSEWIKTINDNANDGDGACAAEQRSEVEFCAKDYDEEGLTTDAYARFALEWARSGARIIGGCCGSRPKHMSKVATVLKDFV